MHFLEIKMMLAMQRARRGFVAEPLRVLAREIIRSVAEAHALSVNDLVCHSHRRALVVARHEAAYEIARLTDLSLVQIGRALGGRDHTTMIHSISAHAERHGLPVVRGLKPKVRKP
jgi:chromosomal replication initiation ATPase DnaA